MSKKYYPRKSNNRTRNLVLASLILICFIYYFYNRANENSLLNFISDNLIIQSIALFGTLLTFLALFLKLTFIKQLSDEEIIDNMEEKKKKDEQLAQIIEEATIG